MRHTTPQPLGELTRRVQQPLELNDRIFVRKGAGELFGCLELTECVDHRGAPHTIVERPRDTEWPSCGNHCRNLVACISSAAPAVWSLLKFCELLALSLCRVAGLRIFGSGGVRIRHPGITTVLAGIGVARDLRVRPDPFRLRSTDVLPSTGA